MSASARSLGNVDGPNVRDYINDMMAALQSGAARALNLSLAMSVGASALTIAAKQQGGANANADNPIVLGMRSATASSGDFNVRSITGALSIVVASGATLGHANATDSPIYVYAIDNAGTVELAVSTKFFGIEGIASTTVMDSGADSATVMYSTSARSNVAYLCLGRLLSNQTTAGTWAAVPTGASLEALAALFKALQDQGLFGGTGSLTPAGLVDISGASAGQIKFPATQNASSNANTLDDYEEGTWTPTDDSGAGLAGSWSVQSATYTKVGRVVHFQLRLTYPATGNTSAASIGGLPFTPGAQDYAVSVYPNTGTAIAGFLPASSTALSFQNLVGGAAITNANLSGATLRITGTYFT